MNVIRDRSGPVVLVTGGAGFIGSHTVDRLASDGCRVVVLDDFSAGTRENLATWANDPRVSVVEGDVADRLDGPLAPAVARYGAIDRIIHFAARVSVAESIADPFADIRVNYQGTAQVLEYARARGVAKVVLASSSAVYGDCADLPIAETAPTRPLSPYGVDKLGGENFLGYCAAVHGLAGTALRFFNVFGPRQDPASPYSGVISIFVRRALDGAPIVIYGDGGQTRDFVYVGDVAAAVARCCLSDAGNGDVINLGSGIETRIDDLARLIVAQAGTNAAIRHEPPRSGDIYRSVANIDRAVERLAFHPGVDLTRGLQLTMDWMRGRPLAGRPVRELST